MNGRQYVSSSRRSTEYNENLGEKCHTRRKKKQWHDQHDQLAAIRLGKSNLLLYCMLQFYTAWCQSDQYRPRSHWNVSAVTKCVSCNKTRTRKGRAWSRIMLLPSQTALHRSRYIYISTATNSSLIRLCCFRTASGNHWFTLSVAFLATTPVSIRLWPIHAQGRENETRPILRPSCICYWVSPIHFLQTKARLLRLHF